jgi:Glycosyl transferase family 2
VEELIATGLTTEASRETVVVIPTRNRADLAIKAVRSVLDQPVNGLQVIVSDNSTIEADRSSLKRFCSRQADPRLLYLAPSKPLSMTEHWDWAMGQALERYSPGNIIYLTDRSLFKPGALSQILTLAKQHPGKVISYDWVTIFDHLRPITVEQQPQTGQLLAVSTSRLLFLSSRSIFPRCLPRMMNCCVPLAVIERIQKRFGSVFASTSPDYNFAYRCLEVVEEIFFYDHAAFVSYAISRSTGAGWAGIPTEGSRDFLSCEELRGRRRNHATPVPAFDTAINYMVQEYCLVRQESLTGRFPRLRVIRYLAKNAKALLIARLYRLPPLAVAFLISLRSKMRAVRGRPVATAFRTVEDAINYATTGSTNQEGWVARPDPRRRE